MTDSLPLNQASSSHTGHTIERQDPQAKPQTPQQFNKPPASRSVNRTLRLRQLYALISRIEALPAGQRDKHPAWGGVQALDEADPGRHYLHAMMRKPDADAANSKDHNAAPDGWETKTGSLQTWVKNNFVKWKANSVSKGDWAPPTASSEVRPAVPSITSLGVSQDSGLPPELAPLLIKNTASDLMTTETIASGVTTTIMPALPALISSTGCDGEALPSVLPHAADSPPPHTHSTHTAGDRGLEAETGVLVMSPATPPTTVDVPDHHSFKLPTGTEGVDPHGVAYGLGGIPSAWYDWYRAEKHSERRAARKAEKAKEKAARMAGR